MRRKLTWMIITIGFVIFMAPVIGQIYTYYNNYRLLKEYKTTFDSIYTDNSSDMEKTYKDLWNAFSDEGSTETSDNSITKSPANTSSVNVKQPTKESKPKVKLIGEIKIRKIDVDLPIVEGADAVSLREGVGHIPGKTNFGEVGNIALAGHRNYAFAKIFNRLDELKSGDEVEIIAKNKKYVYVIYEKLVVTPDDVSVLSLKTGEKLLTLITCTPAYKPTHRLILHAILKE